MSHFSRFVIDARHSALIQLRTHMCRLLSASSQTFRDRNVNITRICCAVVHARSGCVWRTNSAAAGLGKLELWVFGRSAPGDWFPEAQKMFDLYRNFGGSTCCRKSWIQMQTSCLIHMRPYSSSLVRVCVCVQCILYWGFGCHVCLSCLPVRVYAQPACTVHTPTAFYVPSCARFVKLTHFLSRKGKQLPGSAHRRCRTLRTLTAQRHSLRLLSGRSTW